MAKKTGVRAKSKTTGKVMLFRFMKMVDGKVCYSDGKVAADFETRWVVMG